MPWEHIVGELLYTPGFAEGFLEEVISKLGLDVWELVPGKTNSHSLG